MDVAKYVQTWMHAVPLLKIRSSRSSNTTKSFGSGYFFWVIPEISRECMSGSTASVLPFHRSCLSRAFARCS